MGAAVVQDVCVFGDTLLVSPIGGLHADLLSLLKLVVVVVLGSYYPLVWCLTTQYTAKKLIVKLRLYLVAIQQLPELLLGHCTDAFQ